MATQGPSNPATASGTGWTNPTDIESNGGFATWTTLAGNADTTNALVGTAFGFSIPAGATVNGIVVSFVRKLSSLSNFSASTTNIHMLKAGSLAGTAKGPGSAWTTPGVTETWGTTSDLWGTTWTPAQINDSGFGFQIVVDDDNTSGSVSRTLSVNDYLVTITYTTVAGVTTSQAFLFGF